MAISFVQLVRLHQIPYVNTSFHKVSRLYPIHAKAMNGFYAPSYKSTNKKYSNYCIVFEKTDTKEIQEQEWFNNMIGTIVAETKK